MVISWYTPAASPAAMGVRYGPAPTVLSESVTASMHTYNASVGFFYDAVLVGLAADTQYFYSCGSDAGGWTSPAVFRTGRANTTAFPFTAAVYGDFGVQNSQHVLPHLQARAASGDFDAVIHVGDIAYSDDYPPDQYESVWNQFMANIEPIASQIPYMVRLDGQRGRAEEGEMGAETVS